MIVYGSRTRRVRTAGFLHEIQTDLDRLATLDAGLERHAAITTAFVALGQAVQGIADADLALHGEDGHSIGEAALMKPLGALARAVTASWDSDFSFLAPLPVMPDAIPDAAEEIELRLPEGYACYALYPEAYALAARALGAAASARVIGIRSIGTGLAAMVAAELGTPPALTVRPLGHPFDRHIRLSPDATASLLEGSPSTYVIVDEGPGLSGSSFASVAAFLESHHVPAGRIVFLTSHDGPPGNKASEKTLSCWGRVQRVTADSNALISSDRVTQWLTPLLGPLNESPADISAGRWRARIWPDERCWPPIIPDQERRKFLARTGGATWLVKFAGLGRDGERKLRRGSALHTAGLIPEVKGLLHGFLVQRWIQAVRLKEGNGDAVADIGRYLAARAAIPAEGSGASIAELFSMAQTNIGTALGVEATRQVSRWQPQLERLQSLSNPCESDNRCQPHEWLRLADGSLMKADALDHHMSHDLIGAQDIAWDIAGAAVEFRWPDETTQRLRTLVEDQAGRSIDLDLLLFLKLCYLAFRIGTISLALEGLAIPAEGARNRRLLDRYIAQARVQLGGRDALA